METNNDIEQMEIPDEPQTAPLDNAKSLSELMKLSITEDKKFVPLDKFKWMVDLNTDSVFYIIKKIQDEEEVIKNDWHFIPYDIPPEIQAEFDRKKGCIHFFCIDDAKTLKRFTKKIKKYFPFSTVDWQPFDHEIYKKGMQGK